MNLRLKTFENFQEPDMNNDDKSETYLYVIHNDDEHDFQAEVRSESGKCILDVDKKMMDDGHMDHKDDLSGLREYLIDKKKIRQHDEVTMSEMTNNTSFPVTESIYTFDMWTSITEDEQIDDASVDVLPGGRGDGRMDSDFDELELELGIAVELEHTNDKDLAKEIAKDHLTENPAYYTEGFGKGIFDEDISAIIDKWGDDPRVESLKNSK